MCELLGLSSSVATHLTLSLHELSQHGGRTNHHADGWGLATYSGKTGDQSPQASVIREAAPAAFSKTLQCVESHHSATQCAIAHIRRATQGAVALRNTQPFEQDIQGRTHLFAHNGDLHDIRAQLPFTGKQPKGETDSECAFYFLMTQLAKLWENGIPTLQARAVLIHQVFLQFSELGPANILYSDGDYLYAFANKRMQPNGQVTPPGLYYLPRECDCDADALQRAGVHIGCQPNKVLLFASVPLTKEEWIPFAENQLIVSKDGNILSWS